MWMKYSEWCVWRYSCLQAYLPKTVRISGFLTGGFEAIWPPNWGDFAKKECVTATSRSFKPGGLAIIWTVGNNNNVGGLERNSLILYKWGLESFILYMWGASKEIPPFPIYGGIISRSPHVLHVGGFKRNPPFPIYGGIISRSPHVLHVGGVWKKSLPIICGGLRQRSPILHLWVAYK